MQKTGIKNVTCLVKDTIATTVKKMFDIDMPKVPVLTLYSKPDDFQSAFGKALYNGFKKRNPAIAAFPDATSLSKKVCEEINAAGYSQFSKFECNEDGFVFVKLSEEYLAKEVAAVIVPEGSISSSLSFDPYTVVVDFSSPNIAKEMHVGHLRSTIMGETICRIFEFMGNDVKRQNHIGDWGTQFGMLICYLFDAYPDCLTNMPDLRDLEAFYVKAKTKFKEDEQFQDRARQTVVKLQSGDEEILKAWVVICDISRSFFTKIYSRLGITNNECGESFYNPMLNDIVTEMESLNLLKLDDGAMCYFKSKKKSPLIVRKTDGGYGYPATDLAACKYRIGTLKADRVVIITDQGQGYHFELVFHAAFAAGWAVQGKQRLDHMGTGLVLKADGRPFKSSDGNNVKLVSLLDESRDKAIAQLRERFQSDDSNATKLEEEEIQRVGEIMGIGAVRYFDMRQSRTQNYKFDSEKMTEPKGDTAIYLLYSYARLCSIIRKSGVEAEALRDITNFKVTDPAEISLLSHLAKFTDMIEVTAHELALNKLCAYTYQLACIISSAYGKYKIIGNEHTLNRVVTIEIVRITMEKCLHLLGITPLEKI